MDAEIPTAVQIGGYARGYHDVRPHWLRKVPPLHSSGQSAWAAFIIAAEVENLLFCRWSHDAGRALAGRQQGPRIFVLGSLGSGIGRGAVESARGVAGKPAIIARRRGG